MWVGGCVIAPVGRISPPRRRRRSVHRWAKMASRRRFRAFVYTVAPWAWVVSGLGITIVYTNGRIGPLRAGLGHLCTLLGCCAVVDNRGDAGVYTNWLKWPLGAVLGHLCTLLRRESPRRQPTRTPEEPKKDMSLRIIWQENSAGETMLDRSWRYFPATLYAPCLARLRCPASF